MRLRSTPLLEFACCLCLDSTEVKKLKEIHIREHVSQVTGVIIDNQKYQVNPSIQSISLLLTSRLRSATLSIRGIGRENSSNNSRKRVRSPLFMEFSDTRCVTFTIGSTPFSTPKLIVLGAVASQTFFPRMHFLFHIGKGWGRGGDVTMTTAVLRHPRFYLHKDKGA